MSELEASLKKALNSAIGQKIAIRKDRDRLKAELEKLKHPTTEPRSLVKQVCKTCIFIMGAFAGAVVCVMVLQAKGLIV